MLRILILFMTLPCFAETVSLKANEWKKIDQDLKFRVTKVLEDSRCPSDVQCVWAGRIEVEVEFVSGKLKSRIKFSPDYRLDSKQIKPLKLPFKPVDKNFKFMGSFSWKDKNIVFKKVAPYPGDDKKVPMEPNRFIFKISDVKNK